MAGDNSYKPGEMVQVSGIYSVVHDDGKDSFKSHVRRRGALSSNASGKGAHLI